MFVHEYLKLLENPTQETIIRISKDLAEGNITYAFPYQMKEFIIKYSAAVLQLFPKE